MEGHSSSLLTLELKHEAPALIIFALLHIQIGTLKGDYYATSGIHLGSYYIVYCKVVFSKKEGEGAAGGKKEHKEVSARVLRRVAVGLPFGEVFAVVVAVLVVVVVVVVVAVVVAALGVCVTYVITR